jgi:hypothetical protein
MRLASRAERIEPFYVMEVAKAAAELGAQVAHTDAPMLYLNIGEPDFTAPPLVQAAAERAIRDGRTQYTSALGLPALRERVSDWYRSHFGLQIPAQRIVITAGASAARSELPVQPAFCECGRGTGRVVAHQRRTPLSAECRSGAQTLGGPHPRRVAGLSLQPHGHVHRP